MHIALQKMDGSLGTTFPQEVLDKFNLKEGDALTVVVMKDGIKLMAYDPESEEVMKAYRQGASEYHDAMQQLAE